MNRTWMSGLAWASAGLVFAALGSGCASTGGGFRGWWSKNSSTASAPTLASQNVSGQAAQPQIAQQNGLTEIKPTYASAAGSPGGNVYAGNAVPAMQASGASGAGNQFAPQPSPPLTAGQYGGQRTCPVTGQPLGSMGPPVPVTYNGKTIYLCCEGCVQKFQSNPVIYAEVVELETNPSRRYASDSPPRSSGCSSGGCSSGGCSRCGR